MQALIQAKATDAQAWTALLVALDDNLKAAIAACYYADLSHEEAALALGIPVGTVKTHVLRGKTKLRAGERIPVTAALEHMLFFAADGSRLS